MSEDLNDSDSSCEWAVVSPDGKLLENYEAPKDDTEAHQNGQLNKEEICDPDPGGIGEPHILDELRPPEEDNNATLSDVGESDTSSDIEKIDEPLSNQLSEDSESVFLRSSDHVTTSEDNMSEFSKCSDINPLACSCPSLTFETREKVPDVVTEDHSDTSVDTSDQELQLLELSEQLRSYRHMPNQRVNIALNLLVALAVTAVIGLGIGHFIGWSSQWFYQHQLQQTQMARLKSLQDELIKCLRKQQSVSSAEFITSQPCYEKTDYWRVQFDDLFISNKDHLEALMNKNDGLSCQDDFQMLKRDLLYKQLEHVEKVKQVQQMQSEENKFLQKLKDLEEENNDLRMKLEKEEEEEAQDQKIMFLLMKENAKLKLALEDVRGDVQEELQIAALENQQFDLGNMKEKINQLTMENEDLRHTIARLRYSPPPANKIPAEIQNNINKLKNENMDLKLEIGRLRYAKPPNEVESNNLPIKSASLRTGLSPSESSTHSDSAKENDATESKGERIEDVDEDKLNISNNLTWVTSGFSWLESEFHKMLKDSQTMAKQLMDKTASDYEKFKNKHFLEEFWQEVNENVNGIIDAVNAKWTQLQNSSQMENGTLEDNSSLMKDAAQIWKEAKTKFKSLTKSVKMKTGENLLKRFVGKFENLFAGFKKKHSPEDNEKVHNNESEMLDGENPRIEDEYVKKTKQHEDKGYYSDNRIYDDEDRKVSPDESKMNQKTRLSFEDDIERFPQDKDDRVNSDWIFRRAQSREIKKIKQKQAEWVFDRARDRQEQRKVFVAANDRSMSQDDDEEEEDICNVTTDDSSECEDDDEEEEDHFSKGKWYVKTKFYNADFDEKSDTNRDAFQDETDSLDFRKNKYFKKKKSDTFNKKRLFPKLKKWQKKHFNSRYKKSNPYLQKLMQNKPCKCLHCGTPFKYLADEQLNRDKFQKRRNDHRFHQIYWD